MIRPTGYQPHQERVQRLPDQAMYKFEPARCGTDPKLIGPWHPHLPDLPDAHCVSAEVQCQEDEPFSGLGEPNLAYTALSTDIKNPCKRMQHFGKLSLYR